MGKNHRYWESKQQNRSSQREPRKKKTKITFKMKKEVKINMKKTTNPHQGGQRQGNTNKLLFKLDNFLQICILSTISSDLP